MGMKLFFLIAALLLPLLGEAEIMKPWAGAVERLSPEEKRVLVEKGTEPPFSGKYVNTDSKGVYRCKVCNAPLYRSDDKFHSRCGWPSFDDAIPGAVREQRDADGRRIEILCSRCGAHLGHVFRGEGFTSKNTRHCVNSVALSLDTKQQSSTSSYRKAYFAGGCFWGVEYYLEQLDGVIEVNSGYMGGSVKNPSYRQVVRGDTGHFESVEVVYDPAKISYEQLAKTFFEIHNPTQADGQGPDIGEQYHSAVFVSDEKERRTIKRLIAMLEKKGYHVTTKILPKQSFYKAEAYHQDYYERHGKKPYCHTYIKRF